MKGRRVPVDQAVIFPLPVLSNSTKTPFTLGNAATVGAQFTLDFPSIERSEIRREFCPNKTFLSQLCPGSLWESKEICGGERAETCSTKLEKFPSREFGTG